MSSLADLTPGCIGFGPIHGYAGAIVGAGELAVAPFDHWHTWKQWRQVRHCGTVIGEAEEPHGPLFAQAMPSGFEIIEMGAEHWTPEWVYLRPNYQALSTGPAARPGVSQADTVTWLAQWMAAKHIPYGFEDYAAIAGHRAGIRVKGLDDFIARTDDAGLPQRAICSQAVDAQLTLSGGLRDGKVFDDGRLPQNVTPSELYLRLLEVGVEVVFRPGAS